MRNYSEEVEVRVSAAEESTARGPEPTQFLWRGRLWKVRAVLARWVETPPWWPNVSASAAGQGETRGKQHLGEQDPATVSEVSSQMGASSQLGPGSQLGELVQDRECWRVEAGDRSNSGVFDLALAGDGRWQLVGCSD